MEETTNDRPWEERGPLLCWIDGETTGLDPEEDELLEFAWRITTYDGQPLQIGGETFSDSYVIAAGPADKVRFARIVETAFGGRNPIVKEMHQENGLWRDVSVRPSAYKLDPVLQEFREQLERLEVFGMQPKSIRFAGTNPHFDVSFLPKEYYWGRDFFSHRMHDMATVRQLAEAVGLDPEELGEPRLEQLIPESERLPHRAWADINRDIAQWQGIYESLVSAPEGPRLETER